MTKVDLQKLADMRVKEAEILLAAGELDGAYYIAGYAIECALKACICKRLSDYWFEPQDKKFMEKCFTHKLMDLLSLADLNALNDPSTGPVTAKWSIVKDWDEQSRYKTGKPEVIVRDFYEAITDPTDGVLQWLKARW